MDLMKLWVEDSPALQPTGGQYSWKHTDIQVLMETPTLRRLLISSLIPQLALNLSVVLPGSAVPPVSDSPAPEHPRQGTSNSTVSKESWSNQKCIYPGLLQHTLSCTGAKCCWTHQDLYILLIPVPIWAVVPMVSILDPTTRPEEMNCMCTNGKKKSLLFSRLYFSSIFN